MINTDNYIEGFIAAQKASDPNIFKIDGQDFEEVVRASQVIFAESIVLNGENKLVVADSTSAPVLVTLPSALDNLGITIIVKWLAGVNSVTIASGSGIDGSPTLVIPIVGSAVHMVAALTGTTPTWIVI